MAKNEERLTLSFKAAPLALALVTQDTVASLQIAWPKTVAFSQLAKGFRLSKGDQEQLTWIKRSYEQLQKNRTYRQYAPHLLPLLSKVDIKFQVEPHSVPKLAARLSELPLSYAQAVASSLASKLKFKLKPLPNIDAQGGLITDRNPVRVISAQPVNELELGLGEFYRQSGLSWAASHSSWLEISYDQKLKYLQASVDSNISAEYWLEIVTEPGRFLALASNRTFQMVSIQPAVPSHGFELPSELSDGGMMERCFDISAELYAQAQPKQLPLAQIFVLWGHRQRAIVKVDHRHILNIAQSKNALASVISSKLSEKHPLLWEELGKLGK